MQFHILLVKMIAMQFFLKLEKIQNGMLLPSVWLALHFQGLHLYQSLAG